MTANWYESMREWSEIAQKSWAGLIYNDKFPGTLINRKFPEVIFQNVLTN